MLPVLLWHLRMAMFEPKLSKCTLRTIFAYLKLGCCILPFIILNFAELLYLAGKFKDQVETAESQQLAVSCPTTACCPTHNYGVPSRIVDTCSYVPATQLVCCNKTSLDWISSTCMTLGSQAASHPASQPASQSTVSQRQVIQ